MTACTIREARPEDAAGIARVHVDSWRSTYRGIMPDEVLAGLSVSERENNWVGILRDRTKFTYVAESDGAVVGFASGGPERSKVPDYAGELYAVYLLEGRQRRGIGRALVRAFAERMLREGFTSLLVWVLVQNPACRFYEALGGIEVRRRKQRVRGVMLDEVAYGWRDADTLISSGEAGG